MGEAAGSIGMAFFFSTVMSVTSLTGAEGYSISATGRKRDRLFIYNFILQIQFSLTSLLFKKHVFCVGMVHNNAWGL